MRKSLESGSTTTISGRKQSCIITSCNENIMGGLQFDVPKLNIPYRVRKEAPFMDQSHGVHPVRMWPMRWELKDERRCFEIGAVFLSSISSHPGLLTPPNSPLTPPPTRPPCPMPTLPPLESLSTHPASLTDFLSVLLEPTPILSEKLVPQLFQALSSEPPRSYQAVLDKARDLMNDQWDLTDKSEFIAGHRWSFPSCLFFSRSHRVLMILYGLSSSDWGGRCVE